MSAEGWPGSWWEGPRGLALRQRWRVRGDRFSVPEVIAGASIMASWALLATMATRWWVLILVAMAIGLWLHLAAVETGSHLMMWVATGLVLGFIVVADAALFRGLNAVSYCAAGVTAVIHNELIRLSHGRRRQAVVDVGVYQVVAMGLALVAVTTMAAMTVAQWLANGPERSWWWVPATAAALLVISGALTILPARNAPPHSRDRWRPGDRIPPHPLGPTDPDQPRPGGGTTGG